MNHTDAQLYRNTSVRKSFGLGGLALLLFLVATVLLSGCDMVRTGVTVQGTNATHATGLNALPAGSLSTFATSTSTTFIVDEFTINVANVKLEMEHESGFEAEVYFNGPYLVDIITGGVEQTFTVPEEAMVLAGVYEGTEFQLEPSTAVDPAGTTAWSYIISGTHGTFGAFTLTSTITEDFEVRGTNGFTIDTDGTEVIVDFKIVSILDNLEAAMDAAGNTALTGVQVLEAISAATDMGCDDNQDGTLDETEDVD